MGCWVERRHIETRLMALLDRCSSSRCMSYWIRLEYGGNEGEELAERNRDGTRRDSTTIHPGRNRWIQTPEPIGKSVVECFFFLPLLLLLFDLLDIMFLLGVIPRHVFTFLLTLYSNSYSQCRTPHTQLDQRRYSHPTRHSQHRLR
jgi:hypothetical protein